MPAPSPLFSINLYCLAGEGTSITGSNGADFYEEACHRLNCPEYSRWIIERQLAREETAPMKHYNAVDESLYRIETVVIHGAYRQKCEGEAKNHGDMPQQGAPCLIVISREKTTHGREQCAIEVPADIHDLASKRQNLESTLGARVRLLTQVVGLKLK
jgi:hypothetical protein